MKKILITGANSYIGISLEKHLSRWPEEYRVDTLDMMGPWREQSFAGYDAVYHVAGIAHVRETDENRHLYYEVNRDLAIETARKAKQEGVSQFVFLSSMSVYGMEEGAISRNTPENPNSAYGESKLQAEQGIRALADEGFAVAVLRPPMVYGEGCKGNYQSLVKFARVMPVFPDYRNKRSMIHIDNLSAFVRDLVDSGEGGLFLPQDPEYVCTCQMVQKIGRDMGRNVRLLRILNPAVSVAKRFTAMGKKAFGDLYYEK